jgi:hypothetical protein
LKVQRDGLVTIERDLDRRTLATPTREEAATLILA